MPSWHSASVASTPSARCVRSPGRTWRRWPMPSAPTSGSAAASSRPVWVSREGLWRLVTQILGDATSCISYSPTMNKGWVGLGGRALSLRWIWQGPICPEHLTDCQLQRQTHSFIYEKCIKNPIGSSNLPYNCISSVECRGQCAYSKDPVDFSMSTFVNCINVYAMATK